MQYTCRLALEITVNVRRYHEMQQLLILTACYNCAGTSSFFQLNLKPQRQCKCYTLNLEVSKLHTHQLSGHTNSMTVIVLSLGFTFTG